MRRTLLIVLALASGAALPLWWLGAIPLPACPFAHWLHLLCPMCGSGRALHALMAGQIHQALHLNPLVGFWLVLIGLAWIDLWAAAFYGPAHRGPLRRVLVHLGQRRRVQGLLFAIVISWTLYANLFHRSLLLG